MIYEKVKIISKDELKITSLNAVEVVSDAVMREIGEKIVKDGTARLTHYVRKEEETKIEKENREDEGGIEQDEIVIRIEVIAIHPRECEMLIDKMDQLILEMCSDLSCMDNSSYRYRSSAQTLLRKYLYNKNIPAKGFPFTTLEVKDIIEVLMSGEVGNKIPFETLEKIKEKMIAEGYLDEFGRVTDKVHAIDGRIEYTRKQGEIKRKLTDEELSDSTQEAQSSPEDEQAEG